MRPTIKPKTLREAIQNIIRSGKYPTIKSDKDFAHALNIKPTTLSNYLNGRLKIGKTLSEKFKLKFHLSLHDMALFSRSAETFCDVATSDELKLFMRL